MALARHTVPKRLPLDLVNFDESDGFAELSEIVLQRLPTESILQGRRPPP
jgi:hypothetical protein